MQLKKSYKIILTFHSVVETKNYTDILALHSVSCLRNKCIYLLAIAIKLVLL